MDKFGHACICGSSDLNLVFSYTEPPEGENRFSFSDSDKYRREIWRCASCGHFVARHDFDLSDLYESEYSQSVYGTMADMLAAYERINAYPEGQSDNKDRVVRVLELTERFIPAARDANPTVLDVGAGLCLFLGNMKEHGWSCTALEPDGDYTAHARENIGVQAVQVDFFDLKPGKIYDLITFNKVLEHVVDPVHMLAASRAHLAPGGGVYFELPDGEHAVESGAAREEFCVEHFHCFSARSVVVLAERAGFKLRFAEQLVEPSGKYTIRCFAQPVEA